LANGRRVTVFWKSMDVQLTPDQKAFARRAMETGRLHSEQDAVQEALALREEREALREEREALREEREALREEREALREERERQRTEFLPMLDNARASLARGEARVITQEAMQQLAREVKERGHARLLAELTTRR